MSLGQEFMEKAQAQALAVFCTGIAREDVAAGRDTPLHLAAGAGNNSIVQALLSAGANVDIQNAEGKTAADLASSDAIKQSILSWPERQAAAATERAVEEERQLNELAARVFDLPVGIRELVQQNDLLVLRLESSIQARKSLQVAGVRLAQSVGETRGQLRAAAQCVEEKARSDQRSQDHGISDSTGTIPVESSAAGPLLRSQEGRILLLGLGVDARMQSAIAAGEQNMLAKVHRAAVQARGSSRGQSSGLSGMGNWTREHPLLARDGSGKVDESSVGAAKVLEVLDRGRVRVVDGVTEDQAARGQADLTALQKGRSRPLHWQTQLAARNDAGERQGCNSVAFAIEAEGGDWAEGWCGVLKGMLPIGPRGDYYEAMAQSQQQDWMLPAVLGERKDSHGRVVLHGHPNVLAVKHAFLGSSQLLVPWITWANASGGALRRRTTWAVMERFPTTLRGAFRASKGNVSGRQTALWLVQVLQGLEHARSRGVVHRDLKAENVFLTADGRAVVGDWGEGALLYSGGLRVRVDRTLQGLLQRQLEAETDRVASQGSSAADIGAGDLDEEDPTSFVHEDEKKIAPSDRESIINPAHGAGAAPFEGSGNGAKPEFVSSDMLKQGAGGDVRAPEVLLGSMGMLAQVRDGWGREVVTAAQAYAWSDAWAAARMMWELMAEQGKSAGGRAVQLPVGVVDVRRWLDPGAGERPEDVAKWRHERAHGVDIDPLPQEAGCPAALEAVLRGLLQPMPQHRIPPEQAVSALLGALYGPDDLAAEVEVEDEGVDEDDPMSMKAAAAGAGTGSGAGEGEMDDWVSRQRTLLTEAEHSLGPLSRAALVGAENDEQEQEEQGGGAGGQGGQEQPAASGAGADESAPSTAAAPDAAVSAGEEEELIDPADKAMEEAVLQAAAELETRGGETGGTADSEVAGPVDGLSMGVVGGHAFEGELGKAVGAGVLQSRKIAERAVVQAGPMAVLRPPSAGTRAIYGWGVDGVLGRVRPLVAGEASLWDRHLRRELLSGENGGARAVEQCVGALQRVLRCFGDRESGGAGGVGEGGLAQWKWDGERDQRWVPGSVTSGALPEQEGLPEGWTAGRLPSGRVTYEHVDGRVVFQRPAAVMEGGSGAAGSAGGGPGQEAPLPAGWSCFVHPRGHTVYEHEDGRMQRTRPVE